MGWLYVVRNAALKETVFKVGETSRFPTQRVKELSSETGVFGSFDLIYYIHVGERKRAEAYAHEILSDSRVSRSKEFFGAPLAQVLQALDETARRFPVFAGTRRKPEPLPQPMLIRSVTCQVCAAEQNVRELLINVRVKCRDCGQEL